MSINNFVSLQRRHTAPLPCESRGQRLLNEKENKTRQSFEFICKKYCHGITPSPQMLNTSSIQHLSSSAPESTLASKTHLQYSKEIQLKFLKEGLLLAIKQNPEIINADLVNLFCKLGVKPSQQIYNYLLTSSISNNEIFSILKKIKRVSKIYPQVAIENILKKIGSMATDDVMLRINFVLEDLLEGKEELIKQLDLPGIFTRNIKDITDRPDVFLKFIKLLSEHNIYLNKEQITCLINFMESKGIPPQEICEQFLASDLINYDVFSMITQLMKRGFQLSPQSSIQAILRSSNLKPDAILQRLKFVMEHCKNTMQNLKFPQSFFTKVPTDKLIDLLATYGIQLNYSEIKLNLNAINYQPIK